VDFEIFRSRIEALGVAKLAANNLSHRRFRLCNGWHLLTRFAVL
jgi:hypothetical protein